VRFFGGKENNFMKNTKNMGSTEGDRGSHKHS
jgi:hypothetical protein